MQRTFALLLTPLMLASILAPAFSESQLIRHKMCVMTKAVSQQEMVDYAATIFRGYFLGAEQTEITTPDGEKMPAEIWSFRVTKAIKGLPEDQKIVTCKHYAMLDSKINKLAKDQEAYFYLHGESSIGFTSVVAEEIVPVVDGKPKLSARVINETKRALGNRKFSSTEASESNSLDFESTADYEAYLKNLI